MLKNAWKWLTWGSRSRPEGALNQETLHSRAWWANWSLVVAFFRPKELKPSREIKLVSEQRPFFISRDQDQYPWEQLIQTNWASSLVLEKREWWWGWYRQTFKPKEMKHEERGLARRTQSGSPTWKVQIKTKRNTKSRTLSQLFEIWISKRVKMNLSSLLQTQRGEHTKGWKLNMWIRKGLTQMTTRGSSWFKQIGQFLRWDVGKEWR